MAKTKKPHDFSGYATKAGLKCSDGRVILKDAFKHQDGKTVPLVWAHQHNEPDNILGHAVLENRIDGVYCYCTFNDSPKALASKAAVAHGDITSMSIYANQLKEQAKRVIHGAIREVSLVIAGANEGAVIDNICFAHGDEIEYIDDTAAYIYTGLPLIHGDGLSLDDGDDESDDDGEGEVDHGDDSVAAVFEAMTDPQKNAVRTMLAHALGEDDNDLHVQHADENATVKDVFDSMNEDQKNVVYYMIGAALEEAGTSSGSASHSNLNDEGDNDLMKRNVFDQSTVKDSKNTLTHDQAMTIVNEAKKHGSLKDSFLFHAAEWGFDPIDILFPDARNTQPGGPQTYKRPDDWVAGVLADTNHTPFARIKTVIADLTPEEARARGYITGNRKREEVIPLMKRITTPTTVYKKQKLDRDDMVDITDFDVVVWLKNEMRLLLNEEIARAVLIGDGRDVGDEAKINEQNVRPIALDDGDIFVHRASVTATTKIDDIIDEFIRARKFYKGSGNPTLYTSTELVTEMLLVKDGMGRRIYANVTELASVLRVNRIVEVELMNGVKRKVGEDGEGNDVYHEILGIVVNLRDYTIGADKGGAVSMFDDFDIDYNQYKYLIETRISGALTRPKSALIMERVPVSG